MSAAHDGGTGAEWSDDESRPSHTKIVEGGQGVAQGGALDSGVVEIIGGQADDGAGGRGGEVESAGGARGTVLASGGLITGAEGEDAGEAVLESHPERERDKGACSRGGAVSGVVSSGTGVPLQQAVAKEELYDALKCVPPHVQRYMQDESSTQPNRQILMELLRMGIAITVANCRDHGFTEDELASVKFITELQTFESDSVRLWSAVAQHDLGGEMGGEWPTLHTRRMEEVAANAATGADAAIMNLIKSSQGTSVDTTYQLATTGSSRSASWAQVTLPCPSGHVHEPNKHTVLVATTTQQSGGCQVRGCPHFMGYTCHFLKTGSGKGERLQACLACGLNGQPTSGTGSAVRIFGGRRCKLCRAQVPSEDPERSASPSAVADVDGRAVTRGQVYAELPGAAAVIDARRPAGQAKLSRSAEAELFEGLITMNRANFIRQMENLLVCKPLVLAEIADQREFMGKHHLDSMLANPDLASSLDAEDRIRLLEAQNILSMMAGKLGLRSTETGILALVGKLSAAELLQDMEKTSRVKYVKERCQRRQRMTAPSPRLTQEVLDVVAGPVGERTEAQAPSEGASSVRSLSQCQNIVEGLTALRARFPREFDNKFAALVEDSDEEGETGSTKSVESDSESVSAAREISLASGGYLDRFEAVRLRRQYQEERHRDAVDVVNEFINRVAEVKGLHCSLDDRQAIVLQLEEDASFLDESGTETDSFGQQQRRIAEARARAKAVMEMRAGTRMDSGVAAGVKETADNTVAEARVPTGGPTTGVREEVADIATVSANRFRRTPSSRSRRDLSGPTVTSSAVPTGPTPQSQMAYPGLFELSPAATTGSPISMELLQEVMSDVIDKRLALTLGSSGSQPAVPATPHLHTTPPIKQEPKDGFPSGGSGGRGSGGRDGPRDGTSSGPGGDPPSEPSDSDSDTGSKRRRSRGTPKREKDSAALLLKESLHVIDDEQTLRGRCLENDDNHLWTGVLTEKTLRQMKLTLEMNHRPLSERLSGQTTPSEGPGGAIGSGAAIYAAFYKPVMQAIQMDLPPGLHAAYARAAILQPHSPVADYCNSYPGFDRLYLREIWLLVYEKFGPTHDARLWERREAQLTAPPQFAKYVSSQLPADVTEVTVAKMVALLKEVLTQGHQGSRKVTPRRLITTLLLVLPKEVRSAVRRAFDTTQWNKIYDLDLPTFEAQIVNVRAFAVKDLQAFAQKPAVRLASAPASADDSWHTADDLDGWNLGEGEASTECPGMGDPTVALQTVATMATATQQAIRKENSAAMAQLTAAHAAASRASAREGQELRSLVAETIGAAERTQQASNKTIQELLKNSERTKAKGAPGLCWDFQKGRCTYDNCKFSHGQDPAPASSARATVKPFPTTRSPAKGFMAQVSEEKAHSADCGHCKKNRISQMALLNGLCPFDPACTVKAEDAGPRQWFGNHVSGHNPGAGRFTAKAYGDFKLKNPEGHEKVETLKSKPSVIADRNRNLAAWGTSSTTVQGAEPTLYGAQRVHRPRRPGPVAHV